MFRVPFSESHMTKTAGQCPLLESFSPIYATAPWAKGSKISFHRNSSAPKPRLYLIVGYTFFFVKLSQASKASRLHRYQIIIHFCTGRSSKSMSKCNLCFTSQRQKERKKDLRERASSRSKHGNPDKLHLWFLKLCTVSIQTAIPKDDYVWYIK